MTGEAQTTQGKSVLNPDGSMPELVWRQLSSDLSAETWGRLQAAMKARDLIAETLAKADAEVERLRRLRYGE